MPFGHTSPAPFGGTLPKGEGLGVVVLNNHLQFLGVEKYGRMPSERGELFGGVFLFVVRNGQNSNLGH